MIDRVGFIKTSLIDYPGEIASVIFTVGCNLRCPYCQNPRFVEDNTTIDDLCDIDIVIEEINKHKKNLSAVVITGGEPTIHDNLRKVICKIKAMELKIGLHTNGSRVDILKNLPLDYVNMSIKDNLFGKTAFKKAVEYIINNVTDYTFNYVCIPEMGFLDPLEDRVNDIYKYMRKVGAKKFELVQFNNKNILSEALREVKPVNDNWLLLLRKRYEINER
jgi:pyruvate formate lyase activating enzyme